MNSTSGNELRLSEFLKERLPFYIPEKKFPDFRVFEQKVDENSMNLLLDWSARPRDIADPWYTHDYDTTYRDVREGCEALLDALQCEEQR